MDASYRSKSTASYGCVRRKNEGSTCCGLEAGVVDDLKHGAGRDAFAAAALADDTQRLAALNRVTDAIDGLDDAFIREKVDLEIRYYGTKPGKYILYDDDGESFNYEKGEYSFREIKVGKNSAGNIAGTISDAAKGKPNTVGNVTWKFMTK